MPLPELALIAQIRRRTARRPAGGTLIRGIGDDCAVLRIAAGHDSLVTTDFSLEGIHFRRDWHSAESVGHRCLARGLSDIAAMGGEPVAAFLSLALPRHLPQSWVQGFIRGLMRLARQYAVPLAGGDTAESPAGILADIVVVGSAPKGRAILRSGAKPGHLIYVTGALGGSAAALQQLQAQPGKKPTPRHYPRHFYPEPRLAVARILREKVLPSAMIDLSDGLSTDLAHLGEESSVGARLDASLIPRAIVGKPARQVELGVALHGGEDYELLFTAPPGKCVPGRIAGVPITRIGEITRSRKILMWVPDGLSRPLEPRGWQHFRRSQS